MPLTIKLTESTPAGVDVVVEGITVGASTGDDPAVTAVLTATGFEAKVGQTAWLAGRLLVGLGQADAQGRVSDDVIRRVAGVAARAVQRCEVVAITLPAGRALAEGLVLGSYSFATYRSEATVSKLSTVWVVGDPADAEAAAALDAGVVVANAVCLARDLVNEPGGELTPPALAERCAQVAESVGLGIEVLDEAGIAEAGLGGLLAVNRGSSQPARFVTLVYEPAGGSAGNVALVGKGVTFDSGGLSIKSAEGMVTMKCDMGGAAAVLAAMSVLPSLHAPTRVVGYLPITDNMTGGDAQRVGDVIRYRNGRSVEVLNTDAEGRLILADGLISASEADPRPDAIVDLATLTGAAEVALGKKYAALFSTDDGLRDQLQGAACRAGEKLWPMPLVDDYRKDIESKVADIKNTGGRPAGAITAALFLREFVGEGIPWAHLDIAGPAFADGEDGGDPAGGTGYGVRTLVELLMSFQPIGGVAPA
jgi:leucyl aminopeptidase